METELRDSSGKQGVHVVMDQALLRTSTCIAVGRVTKTSKKCFTADSLVYATANSQEM